MSKSPVIAAFDRLIVDLTRTVDQLERATHGDISIQVGGAVLDQRVTAAILKRSDLKSNIVAGLAGAGFAYASVILELLPLVAIDAIKNDIDPDTYVETFQGLSERMRSASATYRGNEPSPGDNDAPFDENKVLNVLAGLGLKDVGDLEQIEPGVYTGTATIDGASLGALLSGTEPWGPCSELPRDAA